MDFHPFLILFVGIATVIGLIVALRVNAFIALITAAIFISLMSPGDVSEKISRVAGAFGSTAGSIGIVIALAAIIGKAMMDSGAADRVVRMFLSMLGEKRVTIALMGSGFTLSIPVFFDTAFYLLVPLTRSLYRNTKKHYLKYLMAIAAGGAITHTLVPPTPGPLFIANQLGVDLGVMMLVGAAVALPSAIVALFYGKWLDARSPIEMRPYGEGMTEPDPLPADKLPNLALSLAPILLPILLITANSVVKVMGHNELTANPQVLAASESGASFLTEDGALKVLKDGEITEALNIAAKEDVAIASTFQVTNVLGDPNLALLLSAAIAVTTLYFQRRPTKEQMSKIIEEALMSGGIIILITAAGGAFGGMLKIAGLGPAIEGMFSAQVTGYTVMGLAFFMAMLLKFAQGSSTAAMIVTSGMIAAMMPAEGFGIHPVYIAMSIGNGSLVGSWMNDSGFWIFAKMGGLTEVEALKSWTPMLVILGITGMITTLIYTVILPF
jgi:GntP family gluconate:H+ symporter